MAFTSEERKKIAEARRNAESGKAKLAEPPAEPPEREIPEPDQQMLDRDRRIEAYVEAHKKSALVAFFLTLVLGPIGFLYASVIGGVMLVLLTIALYPILGIGSLAFWWLMALIASPGQAMAANKKLRVKAELMAGS